MSAREKGPLRSVRRSRRELRDEVDEEIRFHLELRIAELRERGHDAESARRLALARFGDLTRTSAACVETDLNRERSMHRRAGFSEFRQDVAYALRFLGRRPGFTMAAVATLAIGIGAATAIVSAADHVLLRPLPYRAAERVVAVWEHDVERGETRGAVSPGNFVRWHGGARSAEAFGLAEPSGFDLTTGDRPPEPLRSWRITNGFLAALGVEPMLGRAFTEEEYLPNASPAVLLSYELWRTRFGGDPSIVGTTVSIDETPTIIAGVLPRGADYPGRVEVWAPKAFRPGETEARASSYMFAVARLRDGASAEAFAGELRAVASQMATEYPETNAAISTTVVPIREQILGNVKPALTILLGAVACILLIACANVAGLLLARGAARQHELGVRTALGAGRQRIGRQLLTESLVLAVLGGVAGVAFAWAGVRWLGAMVPPELPRFDAITLDGRVLLFAFGLTIAAALLFGAVPSLRLARVNALAALRLGTRATGGGSHGSTLRRIVVGAEIAIALVLLIGAGLLGRSFVALRSNELGFAIEERATVQAFLWDRNPTAEERIQRADEIRSRIATIPGVREIALSSAPPFHPHRVDIELMVRIDGRTADDRGIEAHSSVVSPDYFRIMDIPLRQGRAFAESDRMDAPRVAIVSESFVRQALAGADPVGARIVTGTAPRTTTWEIVGVVGDVRPTTLDSDPNPEMYVPFAQTGSGSLTFIVQTAGDPAAAIPALRQVIYEVDPGQSVYHAASMQSLVADTLAERRFYLTLLSAFSVVALVLTVIGIYGVMSFTTSLRAHEIGVRIALGAKRDSIVRLIVGDGLRIGIPGVIAGLIAAVLVTRYMARMLYDVAPTDAVTFATLAIVALAATAAGAWLPARRAAAQDPARVLRGD